LLLNSIFPEANFIKGWFKISLLSTFQTFKLVKEWGKWIIKRLKRAKAYIIVEIRKASDLDHIRTLL